MAKVISRSDSIAVALIGLNRLISGLKARILVAGQHEIHYLTGGQGSTVVLLHGIFAEKDHWVDFSRGLVDDFQCVIPDMAGFGDSTRIETLSYDYASQVEYLREFLDALKLNSVHLVGNSMGGTVAAVFANTYPHRVKSVALVGAPHGLKSSKASWMDCAIDRGEKPLVVKTEGEFQTMTSVLFHKKPFIPAPILRKARNLALSRWESNSRIWDEQVKNRYILEDFTLQHPSPCLCIWGAKDKLFDVSGLEKLRDRFGHLESRILDNVGHLPMMEQPKTTAKIYKEFLKRTS